MKSNLLYLILILGLLTCLAFDVLLESTISYLGTAYFVIFCFLAVFLIIRGFCYKIDTNLYLGTLLLVSPIIQILIYFDIHFYWYYCVVTFSILSLASFLMWKYFKDKRHKSIFFVFFGEIVIFLLPFCLTNFSFWYLIIMAVMWLAFVGIWSLAQSHKKKKS